MFLDKIKQNFKKTKESLSEKLNDIFKGSKDIDSMIDDLEETLILSDIGYQTSQKICDNLKRKIKVSKDKSEQNLKNILRQEIIDILNKNEVKDKTKIENDIENTDKKIILVVGVNGVGKTTSIGKLANIYKKGGKKVLIVAADTFRAGATEQLDIWAKKAKCDICKGKPNQDPSSVIFDATKIFVEQDYDILICDSAGRLQNKKNLMDQLEKMKKTFDKNTPNIKKQTYIVLDATTGQNAINQVKTFYDTIKVDGIILTKLDSTAKGGIIISIVDQLGIPVKYIGTGEKIDDISDFDVNEFVTSII